MRLILAFILSLVCARAVTLGWKPSTDPVVGYRLYHGPASGTYTNSIPFPGTNAHLVVPPGTNYFAVTAVDANGLESDFSNEVCWTNAIRLYLHASTNLSGPWKLIGLTYEDLDVNSTSRFYRLEITR